MLRSFFNTSTLKAVVIIILCILIENKFPEAFDDKGKGRKIRISIDLTDWRHKLFLLQH